MADMLPTLAGWKVKLHEVRAKIDDLAVPAQRAYLRSQELIDKLANAPEAERLLMRSELRQLIRGVVSEISITTFGDKYKKKLIVAEVTLVGGSRRAVYYTVVGPRIVECFLGQPGSPTRGEYTAMLDAVRGHAEEGRVPFPVDSLPFRRPGKKLGVYPEVQGTAAQVRERVMALSREGRSAQEVADQVGVTKWTVFRYRRLAKLVAEVR